jgi:hemerythrin superfamily protein
MKNIVLPVGTPVVAQLAQTICLMDEGRGMTLNGIIATISDALDPIPHAHPCHLIYSIKEQSMTTTPANAHDDALQFLKHDHREAEALFKQYEHAKKQGDHQLKFEIAQQVAGALLIHMQLEEEIFYPQALEATGEEDLLNEAEVEHQGAKELIQQLGTLSPDDPMFDANVKVLSEQIEHHVQEEETRLFPRVKKSGLDLQELGQNLASAKARLYEQHGLNLGEVMSLKRAQHRSSHRAM